MRQLLIGVLLLTAAGACSTATQHSTNPCAFVSATDVAPVVGGPVNNGQLVTANAQWNGPHCWFSPQGSYAVAMPDSNAIFQFADVAFLDEANYQRLIAPPTPFSGVHRVDGLGDEAFEVAAPHYEVLFVRKGDYRVAFEVAAGLGSFFLPEEHLARIVVPRLPA